jgi:hypothetical protein
VFNTAGTVLHWKASSAWDFAAGYGYTVELVVRSRVVDAVRVARPGSVNSELTPGMLYCTVAR